MPMSVLIAMQAGLLIPPFFGDGQYCMDVEIQASEEDADALACQLTYILEQASSASVSLALISSRSRLDFTVHLPL